MFNQNALECVDVSKDFLLLDSFDHWKVLVGYVDRLKRVNALENISLRVPKGEILGVIGRNGAGKSTLLRTLGGVYQPSSGLVNCSGDLGTLFEMGVTSHVFQSGRQHAARWLELQSVNRAEIRQLLQEIQEFSELGSSFDRPIYTYSSGMAARLYFSTVTATRHKIYLIDEILSVGDVHFQTKCWSRIREHLSQGASGILVTHDWSAVLKLCKNSLILGSGKIVSEGPTEKVVREYLQASPSAPITGAKFLRVDKRFSATTLKDSRFEFEVFIEEDNEVVLVFSIEKMEPGIGWDVLLLSKEMPVGNKRGHYTVQLDIPKLPLSPGKYYFNISLATPARSDGTRLGFDSKGWLEGNAIILSVDGENQPSYTRLPWQWGSTPS